MKCSFQVQATKQEVATRRQEESARLDQGFALIKAVSYLHAELLIQDHYIYKVLLEVGLSCDQRQDIMIFSNFFEKF